ncbi:MAG: thioredoxin family protein [Synergistales bacterium]|nr:thioredoxin family protein [Synergistales bacterium]
MIEVTKDNFEEEVQQSDIPVVVDLWGPKCGPCLEIMPKVEEMAKEYEGKVKFCKLNVAENRRLVISLRVMGVPTFLFYKNGELQERITGGEVTEKAIREKADSLLNG